ncbi:MAG: beta-galactosidase [bacterium]|nr:beta-galactosidase [bacterium]
MTLRRILDRAATGHTRRWIFGVLCPLLVAATAPGQDAPNMRRTIDQGLAEGTFKIPAYPQAGMPLSYTIRSWQMTRLNDAQWKQYVDLQKGLGFNNISIDIAWGGVEKERGKYDFSLYDARLKDIVDRGMTLQIKLNTREMPDWAKTNPDAFMHGPDGRVLLEPRLPDRPYHSFADPVMNRWLREYYTAVASHYATWPNLFYCSAFATAFESEYHHSVWTDFSPAAERQFREFLRTHYESLDALNAAWGARYRGWDAVGIAWRPAEAGVGANPVAGTLKDGKPDRRYVDFMKYREWSAGLFFANLLDGLREGDPKAQYGPQVGRIVGPFAMRRGTLGAFKWASGGGWIFTDPSPADDYAWQLAVDRAGGRKVAIEIDGPYMFRNLNLYEKQPELYAAQTRECYENGAAYVSFANWGSEYDYQRNLDMFRQTAAIKQKDYPQPKADEAVYVSKWDCYIHGAAPGANMSSAEKRFKQLRTQSKAVDIVYDDVFLADPGTLKRYNKIYIDGLRIVDKEAWDALKVSGVELVLGEGVGRLMDETGAPEWNAR